MIPSDSLIMDGPEDSLSLVLAHGAGTSMTSPFMADMAGRLSKSGLRVARFNFPYMTERRETGKRRPPDGLKILLDTWRNVIDTLGGPKNLFIGGKSMGGRTASMIADEQGVRGLICLGYPFHAPGKRDNPRVAHLETLRTPTLICQGTRDNMGNRETVESYALSASIEIHWLEDGDHSFKPRLKSGTSLNDNLVSASSCIVRFCQRVSRSPN